MKIIVPFIVAVFAAIVFTACSSVQSVESDAYCFSKLPHGEIKKYYGNTPVIIIKKRDGTTYYLRNWTLDSVNSFIEGNGICENYAMDTIQSGYLYVDLLPKDYVIATKSESSRNSICCVIVGIEILIVAIYYGISEGIFGTLNEDY